MQRKRIGRLMLLVAIISIFIGFTLSVSIKNPVQYSLDYQYHDVYGFVDISEINGSYLDSRFKTLQDNAIAPMEWTKSYFSDLKVLYNGEPVSSELQTLIQFSQNQTISLAIDSVWYRPTTNNSVQTPGLDFEDVNVSILDRQQTVPQFIDAILTLPASYQVNFTVVYYGINIDADSYSGVNIESITEEFRQDIKEFSQLQNLVLGETLLDYATPVLEALDQINPDYPTIILQNFILTISLLGGLTVMLYLVQQSIYRDDLDYHEMLYHRGYSEYDIYRVLPVIFISFNVLLTVLISTIFYIFSDNHVLRLQLLVPAILVLITSATAAYFSTREFKNLQPQDATDITINPSVTEYFFLFASILALLVNIYLNLPMFRYVSLFLVLAVYFIIGLVAGAVIYKLTQILRWIGDIYLSKRDFNNLHVNRAKYLNMINIRQYRKYLKISILFGIIFTIIIAHGTLSYQIEATVTSDQSDILMAQYSNYSDVGNLSGDIEVTALIGTQLTKLGKQFTGVIVTSDDIFSIFADLTRSHKQSQAIYFSDKFNTREYRSLLDLDLASTVQFGDTSFNMDTGSYTYYDQNHRVLSQFDFLLFVDASRYQQYNGSVNLIISTSSQQQLETQKIVEQSLSSPVTWLKLPRVSATAYSLSQNLNTLLEFTFIALFGLTVIFLLGFAEPWVMLRDNVEILVLKGYLSKTSTTSSILVSSVSAIVLLLISMISTVIMILLINWFSVISQINLHVDLLQILGFTGMATVVWWIGSILSHIFLIRHVVKNQ